MSEQVGISREWPVNDCDGDNDDYMSSSRGRVNVGKSGKLNPLQSSQFVVIFSLSLSFFLASLTCFLGVYLVEATTATTLSRCNKQQLVIG